MTSTAPTSAADFISALREASAPSELPRIRQRLAPGDDAIGMRMRDVFDTSRAAMSMPLDQVEELFASRLYEARLGALCILDFRARSPRTQEAERAAPSVVGGHLLDRTCEVLHELAAAENPLRRRTAITAPLAFVRWGDDAHLAEVFPLAAVLAGDRDPLVHMAVGIALKHAGARDPRAVSEFLDAHAGVLPRAALRSATEKLDPRDRARHLGAAAAPGDRRRRPG
jgi:hypothetical protein